ncbi:GDSL esterase/lipase [Platanthera guangdongensis]|uniref:GDSL esterase/lipase n=1 Tax=Platanthera guangdongensis TaxID=2320717 RepID=A0ABR2LCF9_9ASPA
MDRGETFYWRLWEVSETWTQRNDEFQTLRTTNELEGGRPRRRRDLQMQIRVKPLINDSGRLLGLGALRDECWNLLGSSLFLAREIGGNDYNYAFLEGKSLSEVQSYVPIDLIKLGAKIFVVPGDFPL